MAKVVTSRENTGNLGCDGTVRGRRASSSRPRSLVKESHVKRFGQPRKDTWGVPGRRDTIVGTRTVKCPQKSFKLATARPISLHLQTGRRGVEKLWPSADVPENDCLKG